MAVSHWNASTIDLISEYMNTRRILRAMRLLAKTDDDKRRIDGMLKDVEYVLRWLESGRNPNTARRSDLRRERLWDPGWIDRYPKAALRAVEPKETARDVTPEERFMIEEALQGLSKNERRCFEMHVAELKSFAEIAVELGVERGTVQTYIERARAKIRREKETNLFLV